MGTSVISDRGCVSFGSLTIKESAVEKIPCVLLCFVKPILGNCYGPGVSSRTSQARRNPRLRIAHAPPDLPPFFFESTQLARQLHQERTQMKVQSQGSPEAPGSNPNVNSFPFIFLRCVLLCFIKPILGNRYVQSRGNSLTEIQTPSVFFLCFGTQ